MKNITFFLVMFLMSSPLTIQVVYGTEVSETEKHINSYDHNNYPANINSKIGTETVNCNSNVLTTLGQQVYSAITTPTALSKSTVDMEHIFTCNNRFDGIFLDGPEIFGEIRDMISIAEHEVLISFYKWDGEPCQASEDIIDGLIQNAINRAGSTTALRVHFLIDKHTIPFSGSGPTRDIWEQLVDANIEDSPLFDFRFGAFHHTGLGNLHDKYVVIDRNQLMILGPNPEPMHNSNFAGDDECSPTDMPGMYLVGPWKDSGYTFTGQVASSAANTFENTWTNSTVHEWTCTNNSNNCSEITKMDLPLVNFTPAHETTNFGSLKIMAASKTRRTNPLSNDTGSPQDQAWLTIFNQANDHINIATPNINDDAFKDAIIAAVGRGVEVNLLVGRLFNDLTENLAQGGYNLEVMSDLREAIREQHPSNIGLLNMRWYSMDGSLQVLKNNGRAFHCKFMTSDGKISMFGNGNHDTQSWNFSQEFNLVVDDEEATARLNKEFFEPVWVTSNESYVELYEDNNIERDLICVESTLFNHHWNYSVLESCETHYCDPDEARSLIIYNTPACRKITLFDDSNPGTTPNDDFIVIETKKYIDRYEIHTFENSFEDEFLNVTYQYGGNLDGKVSSVRIEDNPCSEAEAYCESFEEGDGSFLQAFSDDIDWTITSGSTPSDGTGPLSALDGSKYFYIESSSPNNNKTAVLYSPIYRLSSHESPSIEFNYHMYGTDMGSLTINVIDALTRSRTQVFTKSGNQGNQWITETINLSSFGNANIYLEIIGETGASYKSDMAIDAICLTTMGGTTPYPDLVIPSKSVSPSTVTCGGSLTANVTIENDGGITAEPSFLRYYLSTNTTFEAGDTYLGFDYVNSLTAGASGNENGTLTIPAGLNPGTYYVLFIVDFNEFVAETNENNNLAYKAFTVTCGAPDLIISSKSATPSTVTCGGLLNTYVTVKNNGTATAEPSFLRYYLSTNTTLEPQDSYLGYEYISSLAIGASSQQNETFNMPEGLNPGTYYILFIVDFNEFVAETNEDNNLAYKAFTVTCGAPDLIISSKSATPSTVTCGGLLNTYATVKNNGTAAAEPSFLRYYLSTNTTLEPQDSYLGYEYISSLAIGASSQQNEVFNIPEGLNPGTYYVLFVADFNEFVTETNEDNNLAYKAFTVTCGKPDLIISSKSATPSTVTCGGLLNTYATVKNNGTAAAEPSFLRYYLSTNTTLEPQDSYLGYEYISSLAIGASSQQNEVFNIPEGLNPGTYYVLFVADFNEFVTETNEDNNLAYKAFTVTCGKPDLIISSKSATPSTVTCGGLLNTYATVKNNGTAAAEPSFLRYYLSTNTTLEPQDSYLGYEYISSLAIGASSQQNEVFNIPEGLNPGTYYVLFVADFNEFVTETNEDNNLAYKAFTVTCASSCDTQSDSLALVALYNSTNGANWTNTWNLNQPMDTWHGVDLDPNGCVERIDLEENNLAGIIPVELGNLNNLKDLRFIDNQLNGTIPPELGNLTNLKYLYLHYNQLNGNIPPEIGNLSNLLALGAFSNQLSGTIPAELGNLSDLTQLGLSNNQLSGNIPPEIGNLNNLVQLFLQKNNLTGSIPPEIGNLGNLKYLYLYNNQLSGCYSTNLSNLCSQLTNYTGGGNNFDASWDDFCLNGAGACAGGSINMSKINSFDTPIQDEFEVQLLNTAGQESHIAYSATKDGMLDISLYNAHGQPVKTLHNGASYEGRHQILIDKNGLTLGIYFIHIEFIADDVPINKILKLPIVR